MPVSKEESKKAKELIMGYELLCNYSRMIAMLPIDQWIDDLEHVETVAPFIDPTLYLEYLYSDKGKVLKKILHAALNLKRVVEEVQPTVRKELEKKDG
jgi:hypothetical protein